MRKQVLNLILTSLNALRDELNISGSELSEQTALFGSNSNIDSMGLVTFLLEVEGKLEEQLGMVVRLMDEKAMSQKHSPFRTIQTLTDYICMLIKEQNV